MRDPLYRTPLRGALLQEALARYPYLDVSAIEAAGVIEHAGDLVMAVAFSPLEQYGISRGRFRVMMFLALEEMAGNEPPGPSGIAENLGVTRATMTDLLDGLERDRLIERRAVGRDRRAQAIHLTEEGRQLFDTLVPQIARKVEQVFAPLSQEERKTLINLLTKIESTER